MVFTENIAADSANNKKHETLLRG